jgi:hypothetical protein
MNEKQLSRVMAHLAEELVPANGIDLWSAIQHRLALNTASTHRGRDTTVQTKAFRLAAFAVAALLFAALLLITPQGRIWAQEVTHFFSRAASDALPLQTWQRAPLPTSGPGDATPDPASILSAHQTVQEVEQQSGFDLHEPAWLPAHLTFVGATFEQDHSIARIFYRQDETNGLVLKEESFTRTEDCALCNTVGASAEVKSVLIGQVMGEYVEGVWKLTENGPVWESDPYMKTLRWQEDHIAFELQYMGSPDTLTQADMVAIAKGLK